MAKGTQPAVAVCTRQTRLLSFLSCCHPTPVPQNGASLCSSSCSGTPAVDNAGLELRGLPTSAARVLGLKECATLPGLLKVFLTQLG